MASNYNIEILYDNGIKEVFLSGEMEKSNFIAMIDDIHDLIKSGKTGALKLSNENGSISIIDLSKVTRINV